MLKWLAKKLRQLAGWSKQASDKVAATDSNISQFAWSIADVGAGFLAGVVFAKLVL